MNFTYLVSCSAVALALPVFAVGCAGAADALCCKDFTVGADLSKVDFGVDASIKGQFTAFAQTSSDLSAAAGQMLSEVGSACRGIAIDLSATDDEVRAAEAQGSRASVGAWCELAAAKIKSRGAVNISIVAKAPQCEASFKAEAKCQGGCAVDGKCDVEATPPTCEGGKLEVSCSGSCKAEGTAPSISCSGSCSASCEGSCTAQGGVMCAGECNGTCEGNSTAGQASGKCEGMCKGTCKATAPGVTCSGKCEGQCTGECKATPGSVSVQCDGKCDGKFTPISCKGGTLKAQCKVEAKCEANCKASAEARATCTPGQLTIGGSTAGIEDVIATLRAHLPQLLLAIKTRGEAIVSATGSLTGSGTVTFDPGKLGVKGAACLIAAVSAIGEAAGNAKAGAEGGAKITGALNIN
jgi:hypothetical protein